MELINLKDEVNLMDNEDIRDKVLRIINNYQAKEEIEKDDIITLINCIILKNKRYSINEVAAMYKSKNNPKGVSRQYIYKEIKCGNLKAEKVAGTHFISQEELEKYFSKKNIFLKK